MPSVARNIQPSQRSPPPPPFVCIYRRINKVISLWYDFGPISFVWSNLLHILVLYSSRCVCHYKPTFKQHLTFFKWWYLIHITNKTLHLVEFLKVFPFASQLFSHNDHFKMNCSSSCFLMIPLSILRVRKWAWTLSICLSMILWFHNNTQNLKRKNENIVNNWRYKLLLCCQENVPYGLVMCFWL